MKKHIKVTLHFTIDIDENAIPVTGIEDTDELDYNERQKRLVAAIVSDKQRLDDFSKYQILGDFERMTWQDWHDLLYGKETPLEEIMTSSIQTLPDSDQQWFAEAKQEDLFYENTEMAQDCFSTELNKVDVVIEE